MEDSIGAGGEWEPENCDELGRREDRDGSRAERKRERSTSTSYERDSRRRRTSATSSSWSSRETPDSVGAYPAAEGGSSRDREDEKLFEEGR